MTKQEIRATDTARYPTRVYLRSVTVNNVTYYGWICGECPSRTAGTPDPANAAEAAKRHAEQHGGGTVIDEEGGVPRH